MQEKYVHKKMSHDDPIKSPFNLNRCKKEKHIYPNKENTRLLLRDRYLSLFRAARYTFVCSIILFYL
jgi:hypothetical protein